MDPKRSLEKFLNGRTQIASKLKPPQNDISPVIFAYPCYTRTACSKRIPKLPLSRNTRTCTRSLRPFPFFLSVVSLSLLARALGDEIQVDVGSFAKIDAHWLAGWLAGWRSLLCPQERRAVATTTAALLAPHILLCAAADAVNALQRGHRIGRRHRRRAVN